MSSLDSSSQRTLERTRKGRFLVSPGAHVLRRLLSRLHVGRLVVQLPSGESCEGRGPVPGPEASLRIVHHRALRRLFSRGDVGLAEGFIEGDWTSPDLVALMRLAAANSPHIGAFVSGSPIFRLLNRMQLRFKSNSRRGSRSNIMSHYDLGNEFFQLWLDPTLLYSSAVWHEDTPDLESAQQNKLARIVESLGIRGGEHVLEIGCGWGALARRLVEAGAGRVTGLTLSPSQLAFAQKSLAGVEAGEKVDLRLQDYRDVSGQFDRVVSIEMIEAVGEAYWPAYFGKIAQVLKSGGRALIQAITIEDERFDDYRARPDFIQRHIFPGGFLPCPTAMAQQAERAGLRLVSVENFGLSYAKTLAEWRRRFEARRDEVAAQGFDERFQRLWTYYLCYCEAAFREKATDVGFYLLEKTGASA
ncbi:cyclopropane-fatty-acyl-phospholipid synthase family protein [uncultured Rhodoblastus sp.]|uniref:SAM-dependent methyltransferase n=1 Tax=uncultured Rhodoblastus sp. TaxID=543037 RepID=UPI0025F4FCF3|nr:cyclopropane-fatty-acyl-phospholipid synthase family protein [uncultured Rhodoblastus sp.]